MGPALPDGKFAARRSQPNRHLADAVELGVVGKEEPDKLQVALAHGHVERGPGTFKGIGSGSADNKS